MKKLIVIVILIMVFLSGCSLLENPYKQQLEIHKMKIDQGKMEALTIALEAARTERIGVERQYQRKIARHNALITAYVRVTGEIPEDIKKENILSIDYLIEESELLDSNYQEQVSRINKAYDKLFKAIRDQDIKIEVLDSAIEDIEEAQRKIYIDASRDFASVIFGTFVIPALAP